MNTKPQQDNKELLETALARIETLENTLNEIIDICEDTTPLFPLNFIDQRRELANIAKQALKGKEE